MRRLVVVRDLFGDFMRGLDLLIDAGLRVRLKAMALRSNAHELGRISCFCRERTKDYYRFDPQLHLRFDGNAARNIEIQSERLSPLEVVDVERADEERFAALQRGCSEGRLVRPELEQSRSDRLFCCDAGNHSFTVGHNGVFRLCSSLCHPETTYDLRSGSLREAWDTWVPHVRGMRGSDTEFLTKCSACSLVDMCLWCPAHAALETGAMDGWVEYFCEVAHTRAAAALECGESQPSRPAPPTG